MQTQSHESLCLYKIQSATMVSLVFAIAVTTFLFPLYSNVHTHLHTNWMQHFCFQSKRYFKIAFTTPFSAGTWPLLKQHAEQTHIQFKCSKQKDDSPTTKLNRFIATCISHSSFCYPFTHVYFHAWLEIKKWSLSTQSTHHQFAFQVKEKGGGGGAGEKETT